MSAPTTDVELLLNEVRDLYPELDKYRADPSPMLRALRRVLHRLVLEVMQQRPEALTWTEATAAIASSHFTAGYDFALTAPLSVVEVAVRRIQTTDVWDRCERLAASDGLGTAVNALAVSVRGDKVFPVQRESEWVSHDQWRVRYIEHPAALTLRGATATVTMLPFQTIRNALLYGTASELARGVAELREDARNEYGLALAAIVDPQGYEVFRKRDVMAGF